MLRAMLISICLLLIASIAFAQAGNIGIFGNDLGTSCSVVDAGGLVTIYVLHLYSSGATASQFMVEQRNGACMTYISEDSPHTTVIGNSQVGVAVAYGACMTSPIHVLTINYFGCTSPECSMLKVVPDPVATHLGVLITDCGDPPNLLETTGGALIINENTSCPCTWSVTETSWGLIKSLYNK
ncbi:MAG: hypothetical protein GTO42_08485 [Candidatus Latescibacteria bacterium]|nr:hypothetical protein [Candidatus Latescibacterota bacterium]NIO28995.1 hypothetical protein [Candidatus Latescibacterota bacterium]NIO56620.1 hypothetical protein [Candidatus Latescibacterota bacterium]NIT02204.1 hypothetical protein [Candidatus Latescibacterota bacterium]NIT39089.1 hypothetical protein [Candidatus Latescibacterota bacterium]